jgi:ATP/maltotriose-dependent transcriptional regulator MalT/DNA-binding SARP family transcriptional activator
MFKSIETMQGASEEVDLGLIVRTRFIPPRPKPFHIPRVKLNSVLAAIIDYPLTLLKAEAGYGKTTTIASYLAGIDLPCFWYGLSDASGDPLIYLLHLIHVFRGEFPEIGNKALDILKREGGASRLWIPAVDSFANDLLDALDEPTLLVLDDYNTVNRAEINVITERLIEQMPPNLHIVITTRTTPTFRNRARWRVTGELLEIGRNQLAFTADEISMLFANRTGQALSPAIAQALAAETEGWPIAVQLLSEGGQLAESKNLDELFRRLPGPLESLFDYLAEEVFLRQAEDVQSFLAETALLRRLDAEVCDNVLGRSDSGDCLRYLEENALFLSREGTYRYHPLFQDFLRRRAAVSRERTRAVHRAAATYYEERGDMEEAVFHLLSGGDYPDAARLLATVARQMAYSGRHQTLATWLDQLPDELLERYPELLLARGHAYRFMSRYEESLAAYRKASRWFAGLGDATGQVRALQGQIQVYLDTVDSAKAEPLLRQALDIVRHTDPVQRARLLLLLAENKLNAGQLRQAERLHRGVYRAVHSSEIPPMNPRVYVRDGRLARAEQIVESHLKADPWGEGLWRAPRSHRESTVLLAWIDALTGDANSARHYAQQSLELGHALNAPIVECVSLSRLGHAWLTGTDFDVSRAKDCYQQSFAIAQQIGVPRFEVESFLGLTLIAGMEGQVASAEACTREALLILSETGDRYMSAVSFLVLGTALALNDHPATEGWLRKAADLGRSCGDRYTPCVADLWLAIHFSRMGQQPTALTHLESALQAAQKYGYDFLFTKTPLFGPKDVSTRLMLLDSVPASSPLGMYAARLRQMLASPDATIMSRSFAVSAPATAPLYLQTLGPFRVRRAGQEVERSDWSREKALHLLQYLTCHRHHFVHRDQILDALWPDSSPSAAATGFRVALSLLRKVLSPGAEDGPDFILRDGDRYRLDLSQGVIVDAQEFERLVHLAQSFAASNPDQAIDLYESALAMYRGDYLEDNLYAEWAAEERDRLTMVYLSSVERLSKLLMAREDYERAMRWANTLLAKDPLWEEGYVLLMQCHWKRGNRALAVRVYERCRRRLQEELGISPSPRTNAIFDEVSKA